MLAIDLEPSGPAWPRDRRAARALAGVLGCACVLALGCTQRSESPQGGSGTYVPFPTTPTTTTPPSGAPAATGAGGATSTPPTGTTPPPTTSGGATPPAQAGAGGATAVPVAGDGMVQAGAGGATAEPEAGAAAEPPMVMDYGEGDGSDVVTIGDSWMNYIVSAGGIEGALSRAGKSYRGYAVAGTLLLNGQIPGQYDQAKLANPEIATVIMTGGGNDIMFSGGCNTPEACEASVQALADGLNELWTKMSADGVRDVVYIRYAKGAGTTNSANLPTKPPDPPAICISGPIRCTSIDTTDAVMGELIDGIHPTPAANDRIAALVLQTLEMKGIRR